jgi:hypothetical protein
MAVQPLGAEEHLMTLLLLQVERLRWKTTSGAVLGERPLAEAQAPHPKGSSVVTIGPMQVRCDGHQLLQWVLLLMLPAVPLPFPAPPQVRTFKLQLTQAAAHTAVA